MRELCAGVNVDLGTAAAFREQWAREAGTTGKTGCICPTVHPSNPERLLLKTGQAPGDAVAMTAAIYSLHKAYPGKYITAVKSYWPDVFEYNPDIVPVQPNMQPIEMHYPAIHLCNQRGIHFMQGWCEFLGYALGMIVPLLTNRPHLYFNFSPPPIENFWLVCSGGKKDFTNKLWHGYQEVVNMLKGKVGFVQVGGARPITPWDASCKGSQEDYHPRLDGTGDMVGKTKLRDLFDLVRRSRGVLCGVSLLMHVAAALEKPAIVIAGGREPVQWNAYPKQHYLHTIGALPCSDITGYVGGACWRSRTVPLGDGTVLDKNTCERPIDGVPECMTMIKPAEVAALIMRYDRQYQSFMTHNEKGKGMG